MPDVQYVQAGMENYVVDYMPDVPSGMENSVVDYVPDVQHVQAGMESSVVDYSDIPCNCCKAGLKFHKLAECSH